MTPVVPAALNSAAVNPLLATARADRALSQG